MNNPVDNAVCISEVSNRVLSGKSFVPACKYILTRWYVCLSEVSNRVLFGGWEIFFFYHHVRRRVRGGSYVCLLDFFFLFVRVTI